MGKLAERCADIARRCDDLSPLVDPIKKRLWWGNREAVVQGVSPNGRPVAPLMPSTLARRKGDGPPRAPMRDKSRVITMYEVNVVAGPGKLSFIGGWPGFTPIIEYLSHGTSRMRARPTFGFREIDLDWIRKQMQSHIIQPSGGGGRNWWPFGRSK